jgi:hypothetical protein
MADALDQIWSLQIELAGANELVSATNMVGCISALSLVHQVLSVG